MSKRKPNRPHKSGKPSKSHPNPFGRYPKGDCRRNLRSTAAASAFPVIELPGLSADTLLSLLFDQATQLPLSFTIVCDTRAEGDSLSERTARAVDRISELFPSAKIPSVLAQRFLPVDEIQRIAGEEHADAEVTGLTLLVDLCKYTPADAVFGVGKHGPLLVADLKTQAARLYPDRANNFLTADKLSEIATAIGVTDDPDADFIAALAYTFGISLVPD